MGSSGGDWPLTGRTEELALLRDLRSAARGASAFISGPAGVGKSRLGREALQEADREGWATLAIRGSAGYAGVPLGPFRTVLDLPPVAELSELTECVTEQLEAIRSSTGLLLLADDGQAFDEFSAALLHQVVAAGLVSAIVIIRTGAQPPVALTDIWKDGFAERMELQNLSRRETIELLGAGLGGSVQDSSANGIWNVTAGNPLALREVVLSSQETGALRRVEGEWQWRGGWATGPRLQEIVAARLGTLDPDELTAVELLALAGSLPLAMVTGLTTVAAVQRLEARGLVASEQNGRRLDVVMAQPLHAEVIRSGLPALRQRSIRGTLVEALLSTGARRTADRVRLACWSLESDLAVDPITLALGRDASLFRIGPAISRRLEEIMPQAAANLTGDRPAVPQDQELGIRLARSAYEQSGGLQEGVELVSALAWTGATAEAEAVLAELSGQAEAIDDRLRLALALAWLRFWGRSHVEEARSGLLEAAADAEESGGDPLLWAEVYEQLAGIALNTARPADALSYAERSAAVQGVELSLCVAASAAAAALAYLGRCAEALTFTERAVPPALDDGRTLAVAELLVAQSGALAQMGELERARTLMEWLRDVALADGLPDAAAVFGVVLGEILLRQGRPGSAGRILRDASGLLAEHDLFGYRSWSLAGLARARAMCGEEDSAAAVLEEARRTQPISRFFDTAGFLADIEINRLAGRMDAAVDAARAGVTWARAAGMVGDEAQVLEAWLRIAPSAEIATRLADLTSLTDSVMVAALADYAGAAVAPDPEALLAVSERFADMSAWWLASEAALAAAGSFEARHDARSAKAAARKAATYAEQCDGGRPPSSTATAGPARLTKREREVATLVVAGRSTKEIARRMYLSPRTVENHLHHAYIKLGVTDRSGLVAALAPGRGTSAEPAPGSPTE